MLYMLSYCQYHKTRGMAALFLFVCFVEWNTNGSFGLLRLLEVYLALLLCKFSLMCSNMDKRLISKINKSNFICLKSASFKHRKCGLMMA